MLSMLLIHLVLHLWLISINLTLCTLVYAHKHSIIHDHAERCSILHCVPALCAYASKGCLYMHARAACRDSDTTLHTRGAWGWNNMILDHASPVLGSGLGKIGQAGDPWIVTPRSLRRGWGRAGLAGRWVLILSWGSQLGKWRWSVVATQSPPEPLPTLIGTRF